MVDASVPAAFIVTPLRLADAVTPVHGCRMGGVPSIKAKKQPLV